MTKMKPSIHCLFLRAACVYSDCYFFSKLIIRRKKRWLLYILPQYHANWGMRKATFLAIFFSRLTTLSVLDLKILEHFCTFFMSLFKPFRRLTINSKCSSRHLFFLRRMTNSSDSKVKKSCVWNFIYDSKPVMNSLHCVLREKFWWARRSLHVW